MRVEQLRWTPATGWVAESGSVGFRADLVIYFGSSEALCCGTRFAELRAAYPGAHVIGGSATATIQGGAMDEQNAVASAISFSHTRIAAFNLADVGMDNSRERGEALGRMLDAPDLAGVFVLADGLRVSGPGLVAGLNHVLGVSCCVTGGMTADTNEHTGALAGADMPPANGIVAAVGLYGPNIRMSSGHASGWDAFGPRRMVTRAAGNVLFELDNKPAAELYERYLGEEIHGSSTAGMLFPLLMSPPDQPGHAVVRTMLRMDQASGAMTFAHDVPDGWMARLMRGNADRLAQAAADAGRQARCGLPETALGDRLALMVTCTGRFRVMGQRTIDEISFARNELGEDVRCLGFYSFGEIAPIGTSGPAALHNQTMTVVGLAEVPG